MDLWFREDVARILASTQETMRASTEAAAAAGLEDEGRLEAYRQGFVDALRAVGVAFGVAGEGEAGRRRLAPSMCVEGVGIPQLGVATWDSSGWR